MTGRPGEAAPPTGRPSEAAMWASVAATLRTTVLGAVNDDYARLATIALIGLAEYAGERGPDPALPRATRIEKTLSSLSTNPIVSSLSSGSPTERAAAALVGAVGRDDAAAAEIRAVLRPLLVADLDEDLATSAGLGEAFRGRLPGRAEP